MRPLPLLHLRPVIPPGEFRQVRDKQGLLVRFLNARIEAYKHHYPSLFNQMAVIEELKINFTMNEYKRMDPFCRAVVKHSTKIELVYPGLKSAYYRKPQHLAIIELVKYCREYTGINP